MPDEPFRPHARYDPGGDRVEVVLSPEPFYGEPVAPGVVVYRGRESGEVVGVLAEGLGLRPARAIDWVAADA